jgi:hypothetical protein
MLETALDLHRLGRAAALPLAAQNRSRARFLAEARAQAPVSGRPGFRFSILRFATASLVVLAILAAVAFGTNWASAQALPGDMLYPVKLMVEKIQISTVQDSPARLKMEEQLDNRRLDEVIQLNRVQRRQPVSFGGLLELTERGEWQVGGVTLAFPPAFPPPDILIGTYVQINGYCNEDVVTVESLAPRQYQWSGSIQSLEPGAWTVGGIPIHLDRDTVLAGYQPQLGAAVTVTAIRLADDLFMAVQLNVTAVPAPVKSATPQASATAPSQVLTGERESGGEKQEKSATAAPRPAAATAAPAAKPTEPAHERETEKSRTPTVSSPAQVRATQTQAAPAVKPSATRSAPTATRSGDSDDKSSD